MDIMERMVASLIAKLTHKMDDLGISLEDAIRAVRQETTAGKGAWERALMQLA